MTQSEKLMADLAEASRIAKAGQDMPLVGGPIGLMWGILLTIVMSLHYMIITQIISLPPQTLNFLWIGFAVTGGIGSAILGQKADKKPGASSIANRVEQSIWMMFVAAMASLAVGVILNLILRNGSYDLWAFILIAGFAGQGLAYGVIAKLTKHNWLKLAALGSFLLAAISMSFYGDNVIYLIAAIGSFFTVAIPSLFTMKAEK